VRAVHRVFDLCVLAGPILEANDDVIGIPSVEGLELEGLARVPQSVVTRGGGFVV
jgi:hypothetical protein